MTYYPRIPPACFQANFAPSSLLQDWGASGVGDYTDPYTGLYLDDLYAAEAVYGQGYVDANLTAQAQGGFTATEQPTPSLTASELPTPSLTASEQPTPSLTASELPTPSLTSVPNPGARMKNAEYPTSAMLIGELQSTQDMARAILDVMQGQNRRPAPWVEYKLQLAQRRLRDAVLYVAYGHSPKQANPAKAPGYMARQALTQVAEDASFLAEVIEPDTELPEWTAAYIHDAQIEVQSVYVYAVRASKKAANPLNDRQKQALEGVRQRAGTDKAKPRTEANPSVCGDVVGSCVQMWKDAVGRLPTNEELLLCVRGTQAACDKKAGERRRDGRQLAAPARPADRSARAVPVNLTATRPQVRQQVRAGVAQAQPQAIQRLQAARVQAMQANPAVHGRGPVGRGGWAMTMGRGMAREQNPICDKPWHTGKLECDTDQYTYGDPNCRCEVKQTFKQVPFGPDTWGAKIAPRGPQRRAPGAAPARLIDTRRAVAVRQAMRGNPAGAGGLVGVCPPGTSYAGTMPRPSNAWAAVCTEDRTGEVVTTFGTARTYPYQHLGYFGYHGY